MYKLFAQCGVESKKMVDVAQTENFGGKKQNLSRRNAVTVRASNDDNGILSSRRKNGNKK